MSTTALNPAAFKAKYGAWAVISGASDGTGAAFARELGAWGLNLVLVARRPGPLEALGTELRNAHGVTIRTASIDLFEPGAAARVHAAAVGLEVGLFISNAGADTSGTPFLDAPFGTWQRLIQRNVITVAETVYGFAGPMRARGRGGILLMGSGAGLGGQPGVAVYSSTKAFDLNLAESLWAELGPSGVDVLGAVCPAMNTPTLQATLAKHGVTVSGLFDPVAVARTLLARLPDGPTHVFAFGPDAARAAEIEATRRARVAAVREATKLFFGDK